MSEAHALKIQLVEIINKLPDDKLQGVLDFVNSLLNQKGGISQNGAFPAGRDPLLDFIGIADGGLLPFSATTPSTNLMRGLPKSNELSQKAFCVLSK